VVFFLIGRAKALASRCGRPRAAPGPDPGSWSGRAQAAPRPGSGCLCQVCLGDRSAGPAWLGPSRARSLHPVTLLA